MITSFSKAERATIGFIVDPGEYKPETVLFNKGFKGSLWISFHLFFSIPYKNKFGLKDGEEFPFDFWNYDVNPILGRKYIQNSLTEGERNEPRALSTVGALMRGRARAACMQSWDNFSADLSPHQFAVGLPGGCGAVCNVWEGGGAAGERVWWIAPLNAHLVSVPAADAKHAVNQAFQHPWGQTWR